MPISIIEDLFELSDATSWDACGRLAHLHPQPSRVRWTAPNAGVSFFGPTLNCYTAQGNGCGIRSSSHVADWRSTKLSPGAAALHKETVSITLTGQSEVRLECGRSPVTGGRRHFRLISARETRLPSLNGDNSSACPATRYAPASPRTIRSALSKTCRVLVRLASAAETKPRQG